MKYGKGIVIVLEGGSELERTLFATILYNIYIVDYDVNPRDVVVIDYERLMEHNPDQLTKYTENPLFHVEFVNFITLNDAWVPEGNHIVIEGISLDDLVAEARKVVESIDKQVEKFEEGEA